MATTNFKPVLLSFSTLDFKKSYDFQFTYDGGVIASATLEIVKPYIEVEGDDDVEVISDGSTVTFTKNITVSGSLVYVCHLDVTDFESENLENFGTQGIYKARLKVTENNNDESIYSNYVGFYGFTTPTVTLSGLSPDPFLNPIQSTSANIPMEYAQTENEPLNYYKVMLLDNSKINVVFETDKIYDFDAESIVIRLTDLDDNHEYYLRVIGETLHGIAIDTDFYCLSVEYEQASVFSTLLVENVYDEASVKITSNIMSMSGSVTGENNQFITIDNKSLIDVSNGGQIIFDKDIDLNKDFTIDLFCGQPSANSTVITMTSPNNNMMVLQYLSGTFSGVTRNYWRLLIKDAVDTVLCSTPLLLSDEPSVYEVAIQKRNNMYELIVRDGGA